MKTRNVTGDSNVLLVGWETKEVGEVCEIVSGGTPNTSVPDYWDGCIPWCTPTDITANESKYLETTERSISENGLENSAATLLPIGALLLCSRATVGEVKIATTPTSTNQGFKSLVCGDTVHSEFIYYNLLTLKKQLERRGKGSTFLEVSKTDVASIKLLLPPLSEQRAIAAALADLDALIAKLNALIAKKRAVKTAAMQRLLTGEQRLPGFSGAWETKWLGEIGSFSKGSGIRRSEVTAEGLPCVRYGELYTHHTDIVRTFASYISRDAAEKAQPLKPGDLLFAGSGETKAEIGMCAAYLGGDEAYAGGDVVILSPQSEDAEFLGYALNAHAAVAQKSSMAQGDAVVHISARHLAGLSIFLPPQDEQHAIAEVLSDMDAEIKVLDARRDKTQALKQGMMRELLTGRTRLV